MKNKKTKTLILLFTFASGIAIIGYNYTFNQKHRNIAGEIATHILSADELQFHFADNETKAVAKYQDQVVKVSGIVTEIDQSTLVLDQRVMVTFLPTITNNVEIGQSIDIKGRCVGFDELLLQVKIDQATLIESNH